MAIEITQGWRQLDDIPVIRLRYADQECVVSLYGAHLLHYFDGVENRLWLSELAQWQDGAAIRGGIPICWPWFGPYPQHLCPTSTAMPNHGLVRTRLWQLLHSDDHASGCQVRLSITVEDIPWSSAPVTLNYDVSLTEHGLTVRLESLQPCLQQAALHSYFPVKILADTSVSGLPIDYIDKVSQATMTDPHGYCHFHGEVDRIYPAVANQLWVHSGRSWAIQQQGQDASVVWNPAMSKGLTTKDIAQYWPDFICVETAALAWQEKLLRLELQLAPLGDASR